MMRPSNKGNFCSQFALPFIASKTPQDIARNNTDLARNGSQSQLLQPTLQEILYRRTITMELAVTNIKRSLFERYNIAVVVRQPVSSSQH